MRFNQSMTAGFITIVLALANMKISIADETLNGIQLFQANGPWHYHSVRCVDTTVREVYPRLSSYDGQKIFTKRDFQNSGVVVTFNSTLGTDPMNGWIRALHLPHDFASVTHYQEWDGNTVMVNERRGDKVQLCFLGAPAPTESCNPDTDARGRSYRVYDYRQHHSYAGENAEHSCGGA